jgi:hypothetical protein
VRTCVLLLYVVMSLLFCVARFLGGGQKCAFMCFVGFFVCSYVVVVCWPKAVFCVVFFSWPALMWRVLFA